jgi:uncharacterized protein (DUF58 family)
VNLLPLLLAVLLVAFLTGSDSLFYLAYVLGGIALVTFIWMRQALHGLRAERRFPTRAFYGEEIAAELVVSNRGRWPILWLRLHESLPLSLHVPSFVQRVVSLAPGEKATIRYDLHCQRRGYYRLGPLHLRTGDWVDLMRDQEAAWPDDTLIVYPRLVPLRRLGLPSRLPFGDLPSQQRIFKDPSRFFGVRDYSPGDSLRQIHWKSSARADHLLVKRFQPSIALNTLICLNLNVEEYALRSRPTAGETGIVVAASIAAHLIEKRQSVGLAALGMDAVTGQAGLQVIPPARGRQHLMRLLETLARAEMVSTLPFVQVLGQASANLGWGSTVIVVTSGASPNLGEACLQMRKRGLHVALIATDPHTSFQRLQEQLKQVGVAAYWVTRDQDLDMWR